MSKVCLNCGLHVREIFEPCPECGMRPTDPALRTGTGKAQYEREQGRELFALRLKDRRRAAKGLDRDLRRDVPMLAGIPARWPRRWFFTKHRMGGPGAEEVAEAHRKVMVGRNGGGLPPGVSVTSGEALPMENAVMAMYFLYFAIRFGARYFS